MQTLVPLLCYFGQRPEESLHETVATALAAICPSLGHFASDGEVKLLLSAYQGNLSHSSASIRRAAAVSLLTLCKHSKKPAIFLGCLVSLVLKMATAPAVQVTGQRLVHITKKSVRTTVMSAIKTMVCCCIHYLLNCIVYLYR